jgi:hypothetical protein
LSGDVTIEGVAEVYVVLVDARGIERRMEVEPEMASQVGRNGGIGALVFAQTAELITLYGIRDGYLVLVDVHGFSWKLNFTAHQE